jgi:hypothetical protein
MRLFAIRLENADTLIVAAADEPEALQKAGLTSGALSYVQEQLKNQGIDRHRADLVLDGVGPQRYEIRELEDIFLHLRISDLGTFSLEGTDEPTYDALFQGYPIMRATHKQIADKWPAMGEIEDHRAEHDALMADAFSQEKTRLMVPTETDELCT